MAKFTVRVVLHDNATYDDYRVLHEEMGRRNLVDVIRSDEGILYRLPPAEYFGEGNVTVARCREIAVEAAMVTGRRFAVFVTVGDVRAWQGLEAVA